MTYIITSLHMRQRSNCSYPRWLLQTEQTTQNNYNDLSTIFGNTNRRMSFVISP